MIPMTQQPAQPGATVVMPPPQPQATVVMHQAPAPALPSINMTQIGGGGGGETGNCPRCKASRSAPWCVSEASW